MATITASAAGGAWSAVGAWEGGVVPGETDDVILAVGSGSITVEAEAKCRSLEAANYKKTLKVNNTFTLKIGAATANGELCLKLGAEMTLGTTGKIELVSTAATLLGITTAGKNLPELLITTAGKWKLLDAYESTAVFKSTGAGEVKTENNNMTVLAFKVENTFLCGSSVIKVTGSSEPVRCTSSLKTETSTIELTNTSETLKNCEVVGATFYNLVFASDNVKWSTCTVENELRFETRGKSVKGTSFNGGATITLGANCTIVTNATAGEKILVKGSGSQVKFKKASGTIEISNAELQNCKGEGGANFIDRGVGGLDKGNNSGWLFDEDALKVGHVALGAVSDLGSRF